MNWKCILIQWTAAASAGIVPVAWVQAQSCRCRPVAPVTEAVPILNSVMADPQLALGVNRLPADWPKQWDVPSSGVGRNAVTARQGIHFGDVDTADRLFGNRNRSVNNGTLKSAASDPSTDRLQASGKAKTKTKSSGGGGGGGGGAIGGSTSSGGSSAGQSDIGSGGGDGGGSTKSGSGWTANKGSGGGGFSGGGFSSGSSTRSNSPPPEPKDSDPKNPPPVTKNSEIPKPTGQPKTPDGPPDPPDCPIPVPTPETPPPGEPPGGPTPPPGGGGESPVVPEPGSLLLLAIGLGLGGAKWLRYRRQQVAQNVA